LIKTFALIIFTLAISTSFACGQTQTEEQALQQLRNLTKDGKLPSESAIQQIESRFGNTRIGALAKILRARVRFENQDGIGSANILNSPVFKQKTTVGDYALWLRGKSLMAAGRFAEAISAFQQLTVEFPNSLRYCDAKLLWAESAINAAQGQNIAPILADLTAKNDVSAFVLLAKAAEASGNQNDAILNYRKIFFYGAGSIEAKDSETKLTGLMQNLLPQNQEEAMIRVDKLIERKNYVEAEKAFIDVNSQTASLPANQLKKLNVYSNLRKMAEAQMIFNQISASAKEKEEAYFQLARGYANAKLWSNARQVADEMRRVLPNSKTTPKTFVAIGMIARDAKNKVEETYFLQTALSAFPTAIDVAQAQFELAWLQHESKNYQASSQQLIDHLARFADKDTTYRGRAGYWSARDSQLAGKIAEACALYDGMLARYEANWYGYLASQRMISLKSSGQCKTTTPTNQAVSQAVANLKKVTVYPETSTAKEQERLTRADDLSIIGLFDWATDELKEAAKTAPNSPKVNFTLATLHRRRDDNTSALLALAKSYPDYSQMKPEEMSREEWDIFYPLTNWDSIKLWATNRRLDPYQVAGLIRQESVFTVRAKSGANAFGLMQLLLPTARSTAKKYGAVSPASAEDLYNPALNIEIGTAFMKDQLDKYGRIEYLGVAYNAGPGRVTQWMNSIPTFEMDEWVEQIPFKETKGYVQGITRNRMQYTRLYDMNGNFKPNVGTRPLRAEIDSKPREQLAIEFPDMILPTGNEVVADE
jgi:soluble lytic murein transglycosylase